MAGRKEMMNVFALYPKFIIKNHRNNSTPQNVKGERLISCDAIPQISRQNSLEFIMQYVLTIMLVSLSVLFYAAGQLYLLPQWSCVKIYFLTKVQWIWTLNFPLCRSIPNAHPPSIQNGSIEYFPPIHKQNKAIIHNNANKRMCCYRKVIFLLKLMALVRNQSFCQSSKTTKVAIISNKHTCRYSIFVSPTAYQLVPFNFFNV